MSDPANPDLEIVAYSAWGFDVPIVPATLRRDWMDGTDMHFAYQCLPMTLANQSGWFILAPHDATGRWNGGITPADLRIEIPGEPPSIHAMSQVGSGIFTWTIPYVFRTPPGWNLLCRGPANYVKDGVHPLEGLIETDWSMASFSMNWKFTRPGRVEFRKGEPIAMIVPQMRHDLERFSARQAELSSNPELCEGYNTWINSREEFWEAQRRGDEDAVRQKYQKHYFHGRTNTGAVFENHQKKRRLAQFTPPDPSLSPTPPIPAPGWEVHTTHAVNDPSSGNAGAPGSPTPGCPHLQGLHAAMPRQASPSPDSQGIIRRQFILPE